MPATFRSLTNPVVLNLFGTVAHFAFFESLHGPLLCDLCGPPLRKGLHFRVSVVCPVIAQISKKKKGLHLRRRIFVLINKKVFTSGRAIFALISKKRFAPLRERFLSLSPKKRSAHRSPRFSSTLQ